MGSIDLFAGSGSISGSNQFRVDHNPLERGSFSFAALEDFDFDPLAAIIEWIQNTLGPGFEALTGLVITGFEQFIESFFGVIIHTFQQWGQGLDLSSPLALFQSIEHLIQNILQQAITGIGVAIEDVLAVIAQVFSTPVHVLEQGIGAVTEWVLDTVFGLVAPDRVPILPIGHLIFDRVNLLTNPQFTDEAIATLQSGEWALDGTVTHSGVGSSARIDANGREHTLLSTDLIPVHGLSPGNAQQMHIESWVRTEDLVGPRGSVRIGLAKYKKADGSDDPTYEDLCVPNQFGDKDWKFWEADWVVEPGVVAVRFHVTVSEEATSGKIWFDDLFLGKNGLLQSNWISGLDQLFSDFGQLVEQFGAAAWATLVDIEQAVAAAVGNLIELIIGPTAFATLEEWASHVGGLGQAITDAVAGFGAAVSEGITNFVNTVFGGFTFNTFEEFITHVVDSLKPQAIFDAIKDFIDNILTGFASIQHVADEIAAALTNFVTSIFGGSTFNTFEEFITHVVDSLKPQAIFDAIKDSIANAIGAAVNGLASIQHVADAIANAIGGIIQEVIDWIKDKTGIDLTAPITFFTSFSAGLRASPVQLSHLDVTAPAGSGFANIGAGVTTAIGNIENTWEQWFLALTGAGTAAASDTGLSGAELTAEQIQQLIATTMANNTMLANIQASLNAAGTAGMSGGDDFEIGTATTLITSATLWAGRGWKEILTGAGRFHVKDRHQAEWVGGGINQEAHYFRAVTAVDHNTLTAYQKITRVTGSTAAQTFLGGQATDLLFGRANDAGTQYVVAGFNKSGVYLKYRIGGTEVLVDSEPCPAPTVGCSYTLECGTAEGPQIYRILRNGAVVLRWDGSGVAGLGVLEDSSHRGWGWGGITSSTLLGTSVLVPSSVNSVTVADNFQGQYVGTYLRAYRSSTAPLDKPIGDSPLADNTFDAVTSSSDLIFDKATQEIVVLKAGPLNVTARLEFDENIQGTERWDLLLYKRAKGDATRSLFARGAHTAGTDGIATNPEARALSGSFSVYCNAGDVLELGSGNATVAPIAANKKGVIGDPAGTKSWITITRGA